MSDIQRYGDPSRDYMIPAHDDGFVVLYADHLAALEEESHAARQDCMTHQADALTNAYYRVEALGAQHPKWDVFSTHYEGCWKHHSECALNLALDLIDPNQPVRMRP